MSVTMREIGGLAAKLKALGVLNPQMHVSVVETLLHVALAEMNGERVSNQDLEARVGVDSTRISNHVKHWTKEPIPMIESRVDPDDARRRVLTLTPRGKALIRQVLEQTQKEPTNG